MKISFPKLSKKILIPISVLIVLIIAALPAYYFYSQYKNSQKMLQNPTLAAQDEIKKIVEKVGKLIELPADEAPTVATVSDKEKLKEQVFFSKSENGDKVLIYTQARKAILYRPNTNKIIEVAPINLGAPETATTSTSLNNSNPSSVPVKLKVALYNGTNITGQTKKAEASISAKLTNMEIITKEDAQKKDYQKTVIIDLAGNLVSQAGQLAQLFNGEITKLPEGEKKPVADILVIIGDNFNK